MAPRLILTKLLTETDVRYRLAFPTAKLHLLPPFEEGANWVDIPMRGRYGNEVQHVLRCVIRKRGPRKPVMERGWITLVRDKGLRRGDRLLLYIDDDNGEFAFEFKRNFRLLGFDIPDATIA